MMKLTPKTMNMKMIMTPFTKLQECKMMKMTPSKLQECKMKKMTPLTKLQGFKMTMTTIISQNYRSAR